MKKKGVSGIITTVIVIALSLILVASLGLLLNNQLQSNKENIDLQSQLSQEEYNFRSITFDGSRITLIIVRGNGDVYVKNETVVEKHADIVFVMDTTGSMSAEINSLKNSVIGFSDAIQSQNISARLALVEFKDFAQGSCGGMGDFAYKIHNFSGSTFTTNVTQFKSEVGSMIASGGNDIPEAHLPAIEAASNLGFDSASKKYLIAISDAVPHAKDCCVAISLDNSTNKYLHGINLTSGEACADPRYSTTYNANNCYTGPEKILDLSNNLQTKSITFYYVNKNVSGGWPSLCQGSISLYDTTTTLTGGKFYEYSEGGGAPGIQQIIPDLANEITREYGSHTIVNHLIVVLFDSMGNTETKMVNSPPGMPLEAEQYVVYTDLPGAIVKIELYGAVVTPSGELIRGPLLDTWP